MKLTRPIRYTNNNETRGIQFWPLVYILMKFGNSQKFPSNLSFCKADLNCLLCLFDASPMKLNFKKLVDSLSCNYQCDKRLDQFSDKFMHV